MLPTSKVRRRARFSVSCRESVYISISKHGYHIIGQPCVISLCVPFRSHKPLSRRQKRRRFENRYWDQVLINTRKLVERRRARKEREDDAVFKEYADIVAKEQASEADIPRNRAALIKEQLLKNDFFQLCFVSLVLFRLLCK